MRARQAVTSPVDVTVPAPTRAEAAARGPQARPSGVLAGIGAGMAGGLGFPLCAAAAVAPRVAAAAAPRTETVNSRRDRCLIGRYDTLRGDLPEGTTLTAS